MGDETGRYSARGCGKLHIRGLRHTRCSDARIDRCRQQEGAAPKDREMVSVEKGPGARDTPISCPDMTIESDFIDVTDSKTISL